MFNLLFLPNYIFILVSQIKIIKYEKDILDYPSSFDFFCSALHLKWKQENPILKNWEIIYQLKLRMESLEVFKLWCIMRVHWFLINFTDIEILKL